MPNLRDARLAFCAEVPFIMTPFTTGAQESPPAYVGDSLDSRVIGSSDLADTAVVDEASDTSADYYQGGYVYNRATGEERRIADDGFTAPLDATDVLDDGGTTPIGAFTLGRGFDTAPAAGLVMEYHPSLPVITKDRLPGIHSLLNRGLKAMATTRRVVFSGNGGNRYPLDAYDWIESHTQFGGIFQNDNIPAHTEPPALPGGIRGYRWDGEVLYLITGYNQAVGTTFAMDFVVPAFNWIKVGSTWAESDVGLVNETDEFKVPMKPLIHIARYWAFNALVKASTSAEDRQAWGTAMTAARDLAFPYMKFDQPEPPPDDFAPGGLTKGDMLFRDDYRGRGRRLRYR